MANNQEAENPIVSVENLTFNYPTGELPAIENVSFTVKRGEFLGIMGPSGAGKTTLCQILKGLIPYSNPGKMIGKVLIDGLAYKRSTVAQVSSKVGFVFQDPEMQIIGLTIEEDLAFGPENYEWDRERMLKNIPEILKLVRLEGFQERETWSLSGGQKQRVAIASALILEPEILILDEPTSELDPIGKAEVFETIRRLQRDKDVTIIMVEHEIEELAEVADRIILMDEGKLVTSGTPDEIFRRLDLFENIGGERVPQLAELLYYLEKQGKLREEEFTVDEIKGVEVLKNLLENSL